MMPLRREVEPPRPTIGPWLPVSLLGTTLVMVLAMGVAVTAERPSRVGTKMKAASATKNATAATTTTTTHYSAADIRELRRAIREWGEEAPNRRARVQTDIEGLMTLLEDFARACRQVAIDAAEGRPGARQAFGECNPPPGFEPTGGVSKVALRDAVEARIDRFASCMKEWDERSPGMAATITLGFRVSPAGRVADVRTKVVGDRIVPQCIAEAVRSLVLPSASYITHVEIDVKYIDGQTRVARRILGTEEP